MTKRISKARKKDNKKYTQYHQRSAIYSKMRSSRTYEEYCQLEKQLKTIR